MYSVLYYNGNCNSTIILKNVLHVVTRRKVNIGVMDEIGLSCEVGQYCQMSSTIYLAMQRWLVYAYLGFICFVTQLEVWRRNCLVYVSVHEKTFKNNVTGT